MEQNALGTRFALTLGGAVSRIRGDEKMLTFVKNGTPTEKVPAQPLIPLRCNRPSLLDLRFTGDPWVVDHKDGTASVRLDNYRLARIQTLPFDLPSLNQLLLQLRQWQIRRRFYNQLRSRIRQQLAEQLLQPIK
jgi:hypothetical protein